MMNALLSDPVEVPEALICAHCGLPANERITENGLHFCCHGCKTAHSFLADLPACPLPDPDIEMPRTDREWLDRPEVLEKWTVGCRGNTVQVRLQIPGIHCASCVQVLERLYLKKHGIVASQVNFLKKELEVTFQPDVLKFSALVQFISQLGYAPSLSDPLDAGKQKAFSESLLWTLRMGVAGFCAGNIMLLSFPEYLGLDDLEYRHFFGWINLVLALPAVFFSGWVYLRAVYLAITRGVLNIDVPIGVGMVATFLLSVYQITAQTGAGYFDSLTGLIFFLLIGRWVQNRTFQFLSFERDFRSYFPLSVVRLRGDSEENVLSTDLKTGDLIRIRHGEIVPCDGILLMGDARIDYSFVSGESTAVPVPEGERILAGGKQTSGSFVMKISQEMSRSQLITLWNNPVFLKDGKPRLRSFSDTVARYFTPFILVFASGVGLFWVVVDPSKSVYALLSVLIIACPCTLSLAYPIALGNTMRLWGRQGFFLKNADVVERLAQTQTLVFDKTGTLTHHLGVRVTFQGLPLSEQEQIAVSAVLVHSQHPLSQAVVRFLALKKLPESQRFYEEKGKGVFGEWNQIEVKAGSASWMGMEETDEGGSAVHLLINDHYQGCFRIEAAPYPFVERMLQRLSSVFRLHLLSGDHSQGQGFWLRLFSSFGGNTSFAQSPESKLRYIQALQQKGRMVGMIGDGLNDAGALRQADTGIALAATAHQFTPGSDAILLADRLSSLPDFFSHARHTLRVVQFCFLISLVYNLIGLSFAVRGDLQPVVAAILMPVSSLTVVLVAWAGSGWFTPKKLVG